MVLCWVVSMSQKMGWSQEYFLNISFWRFEFNFRSTSPSLAESLKCWFDDNWFCTIELSQTHYFFVQKDYLSIFLCFSLFAFLLKRFQVGFRPVLTSADFFFWKSKECREFFSSYKVETLKTLVFFYKFCESFFLTLPHISRFS